MMLRDMELQVTEKKPEISEGDALLSMNVLGEVERLTGAAHRGEISQEVYVQCMASITNCVYPYVPYEVRKVLDEVNFYLSQLASAPEG